MVTFRGCQLDDSSQEVCEVVTNKAEWDGIEVQECAICREDACNKTSSSIRNLWMLVSQLIVLKIIF